MKKIISLVLSLVTLLSLSLMTATAVETETQPYCELVGDEIYIPANKVLATAYNLENETNYPYY